MCASIPHKKKNQCNDNYTFNSTLGLFCIGIQGGFKVTVLVMNTQRKTLNCTTDH